MHWTDITGLEEHPLLPSRPAQATAKERKALLDVRRQCLINEFVDPLRNGFELPIWEVADQWRAKKRKKYPKGVVTELNLGGNRSSKSERAAKRVVEACLMKPGSRWWCCDSTEAQSRMNQQRLIWKYLPAEWRNVETGSLRRTRVTPIFSSDRARVITPTSLPPRTFRRC